MLAWIGSPAPTSERFLFLDRDGVINVDSPNYIKSRREFEFFPDALEALRFLRVRDVNVILISNQSGLGRGIIARDDFWDMHDFMIRSAREAGGDLLAAFYCPHRPDEKCSCRKPAPGLILTAAKIYRIPLSKSITMIGDNLKDVQAAFLAGCTGALLQRFSAPEIDCPSDLSSQTIKRYPTLMDAALLLSERDKAW